MTGQTQPYDFLFLFVFLVCQAALDQDRSQGYWYDSRLFGIRLDLQHPLEPIFMHNFSFLLFFSSRTQDGQGVREQADSRL